MSKSKQISDEYGWNLLPKCQKAYMEHWLSDKEKIYD